MEVRKSSKCDVLNTNRGDVFQMNEKCLCTNEEITMDNFCVLLSLAIIKFSKKNDDSLKKEPHLVSNEILLKCWEIETELMWHIIPKNMLSGEQAFFLSLLSTSCTLVTAMVNACKEDCLVSNNSLKTAIIHTKSKTDDKNTINEATNITTKD